jgi:hypothetical protein
LSETDHALSRLAQQETWRKRLSSAEVSYHDAAEELRLALLRKNGAAAPDSEPEIAAAKARKAAARAEYLRVLRVFTDLVLRGKTPSESGG